MNIHIPLNAIKALALSALLTSAACAEEAKSPISPLRQSLENSSDGSDEHNDLDLMALTFTGKDLFGSTCSLHISGFEDEHEGEETAEEHEFKFVVKVSYSIHGQKIKDSLVDFRRYDLDENTFYPLNSGQMNTTPALVSALLKDENIVVDYNSLVDYERSGQLLQSLRADFYEVDVLNFTKAIEAVVEDPSLFDSNKESLDQLERTVLKIQHNGHYDAAACSNFKLTGIEQVEFELDADHDGDDDDHDGHDH